MFFFQQPFRLLLFSVPNEKVLHNTGVYKLTSVTYFAKNSWNVLPGLNYLARVVPKFIRKFRAGMQSRKVEDELAF